MIQFDYHPHQFVITPALCVGLGECENEACQSEHVLITFSWFLWTIALVC